MYPVFLEVARHQGELEVERSFSYAFRVEQIHAALYRQAKEHVDKEQDLPLKPKEKI